MIKKFLFFALIAFLLTACTSAPAAGAPAASTPPASTNAPASTAAAASNYPSLDSYFPASNSISTYATSQPPRTFLHDNLFDFVDGQADTYFAYSFQQLAVQSYQNSDGLTLHVEIWQFAGPADAYGVYTISRSAVPVAVGVDGSTTPESRIAFWQDHYYVDVNCTNQLPQADLEAFAKAVTQALPQGGQRPVLLQRLPTGSLVENQIVFFHLEITIQNEIYLSGTNKLGLSPKTYGLLAHYTLGGQDASLLLVEYPDAQAAAAGLQGLKSADVDDLVAAQAKNNLLGGVVGKVDAAAARGLLDQALK